MDTIYILIAFIVGFLISVILASFAMKNRFRRMVTYSESAKHISQLTRSNSYGLRNNLSETDAIAFMSALRKTLINLTEVGSKLEHLDPIHTKGRIVQAVDNTDQKLVLTILEANLLYLKTQATVLRNISLSSNLLKLDPRWKDLIGEIENEKTRISKVDSSN